MRLSATFLGSAATSTLRLIGRCAKSGQLLNVRHGHSLPVLRRLRRIRSEIGPKADFLAHPQAKPVRPNSVSPANTDKVKWLCARR